jgi:hypothetical protein
MTLLPTRTAAFGSQRSRFAARAVFVTWSLTLAFAASAQWGWKDNTGRRVFSDTAPPANVADKDIFKRPGGSVPTPARAPAGVAAPAAAAPSATTEGGTAAAAPAASAASAPKLATKDTELEKKKKEAEAQEVAKKKAAEQEQTKARADNCERAKRGLAQYSSGVRIAQTNAKGEREILDDTQRAAETKRLQEVVAKDCAG